MWMTNSASMKFQNREITFEIFNFILSLREKAKLTFLTPLVFLNPRPSGTKVLSQAITYKTAFYHSYFLQYQHSYYQQ